MKAVQFCQRPTFPACRRQGQCLVQNHKPFFDLPNSSQCRCQQPQIEGLSESCTCLIEISQTAAHLCNAFLHLPLLYAYPTQENCRPGPIVGETVFFTKR